MTQRRSRVMAIAAQPSSRSILALLVIALILAALFVISPFGGPLILAAWLGDLTRPLWRRLARGNQKYARIAAAAVVAIVVSTVIIPFGAALLTAFMDVRASLAQLKTALEGHGAPPGLASENPLGSLHVPTVQELALFAKEHAKELWGLGLNALSASSGALLACTILLLGIYTSLSDGRRAYVWLARHAPVGPRAFIRLAEAFRETGRGLLVGTGATILAQGIIAGVTYTALGVTAAIPLAFLTAAAGLLPVMGTMLVWAPVALGLAIAGHPVRAVILVIVGLGVIGLVDNVVRPLTAHYGKLDLPPFVLIVSLLGGVTVFGASGLILGPLIVRLTVEALELARERALFQ